MINYDTIRVGDVYQCTMDKRMKVKILSTSDEVVNSGYLTFGKVARVEQIFGGRIPSRKTEMVAWENQDGEYYFNTLKK